MLNKAVMEESKMDYIPEAEESKKYYQKTIEFHKFFSKAVNSIAEDGQSIISTVTCLIKSETDLRRFFLLNNIHVEEEKLEKILEASRKTTKWSTCCSKFSVLKNWLKNVNPRAYEDSEREILKFHKKLFKKSRKDPKKQSNIFSKLQEAQLMNLRRVGKIRNCIIAYIFGKAGALRPNENYKKLNSDILFFKQLSNDVGCGYEVLVKGVRSKQKEKIFVNHCFFILPLMNLKMDPALCILKYQLQKPEKFRDPKLPFQITLKEKKGKEFFSKTAFGINNYYTLGSTLAKEIGITKFAEYTGYCARRGSDVEDVNSGFNEIELAVSKGWTSNNIHKKARLYFQNSIRNQRLLAYKRMDPENYRQHVRNIQIDINSPCSLIEIGKDLIENGYIKRKEISEDILKKIDLEIQLEKLNDEINEVPKMSQIHSMQPALFMQQPAMMQQVPLMMQQPAMIQQNPLMMQQPALIMQQNPLMMQKNPFYFRKSIEKKIEKAKIKVKIEEKAKESILLKRRRCTIFTNGYKKTKNAENVCDRGENICKICKKGFDNSVRNWCTNCASEEPENSPFHSECGVLFNKMWHCRKCASFLGL